MSHRTRTSPVIGSSLALALALAIWNPVQAGSAETAKGMSMTDAQMKEHCQDMKEQKQKMKDDMKAQDAELTELVAKMNRAPEDKQLSLVAAVVTRMAEQRVTMDERHAKMEDRMMKHMMKHMQMGKDSMPECPMMKGMKDMDDTSMGAHK